MKRINWKRMKLTAEEKAIEAALNRGEYRPVSQEKFNMIVQALERRKKDAVLNIRINGQDLAEIKEKANKLGIPYQTMISEFLHQYAVSLCNGGPRP